MFDALSIGATGMQAQQQGVETIAHNLANANTVGFKKSRVAFADLMLREGALPAGAEATPPAMPAAAGVGVARIGRVFEGGDLKKTDAPLDLALQGEGFLEVTLPDGSAAFTRGGTLKINRDGLLTTAAGHPLKPPVAVPERYESLSIQRDGRILVRLPGQPQPVEAGQLEVVRFAAADALEAAGDNLYRATPAAGEPVSARPGDDGAASLAQGHLEGSNVRMVDEMVNLMLAQRAYEASVKVVQAADEMLGLVNNLRK